jgi:hypothetical protein
VPASQPVQGAAALLFKSISPHGVVWWSRNDSRMQDAWALRPWLRYSITYESVPRHAAGNTHRLRQHARRNTAILAQLHAQPAGLLVTRQSNVWPWSSGRCRWRTIRVVRQMQCERMCQLRASVPVVLRSSVKAAVMRILVVWAPVAACQGLQRLSRMFLPLSSPASANQRGIIDQVRHNNSSSQLVDALRRNKIALCMGDCFEGPPRPCADEAAVSEAILH